MKILTQVQYSLGISIIYKGKKKEKRKEKHELAPNDRKFVLPKKFQKTFVRLIVLNLLQNLKPKSNSLKA
jgi:hypothetical protein